MKYFVILSLSVLFLYSDTALATTVLNTVRSQQCSGGAGHNCGASVADIFCHATISFDDTVSPGATITVSASTWIDDETGVNGSTFYCQLGELVGWTPGQTLVYANGRGTFTGTPRSFTAPSVVDSYPIKFSHLFNRTAGSVTFWGQTVTDSSFDVVSPQCSDSINNDGQQGADTLDPQCHSDCNVNNPGSYVATHNSESAPPNVTCPTPATLELNGRPAPPSGAFNFVKNFFALITTKAFAGE